MLIQFWPCEEVSNDVIGGGVSLGELYTVDGVTCCEPHEVNILPLTADYTISYDLLRETFPSGRNDWATDISTIYGSTDGHYSGYDCLEMTRDTHYNDAGVKIARYIADYEKYYNDTYLYVGSEHGGVKIAIPRYWETNFLSYNFYSGLVACITNSAIRPLLYLSSNLDILYDADYIYGIPK